MRHHAETIGQATLYLGDALEIMPTLDPCFAMVLADPPYCTGGVTAGDRSQVTSAKYQSPNKRGLYPEFAGDTRDQRSFLAWSTLWLGRARALALPGAICAVFSDWRQIPVTTDALQCAGWVWRGIIPWDKTEGTRPQLGRYRIQAEYVVWGTNGPRPLSGATAPGAFRMPRPHKKHHMTGKPVELMEGLLAPVDGPVLDPFMGSAPVGLACARRSLPYVGIELEGSYFDVATKRLRDAAGAIPAPPASGQTGQE